MKFEIVPRFGEIQLFIFAVSLVTVILLYTDGHTVAHALVYLGERIEFTFPSILSDIFLVLMVGFWLYGLYLSIRYALSDEIPSPYHAGIMVFSVLLPLTLLSLAGSVYWFFMLSISDNIFDKIVIVFPVIELVRGFAILIMIRLREIEYWKRFDYKNARKEEVIAALAVLLITGFACRFFTDYPPYLVILMMYELGNIAAGVVNRLHSIPQI